MTPRQKRFVEEYLIDLNATQAAIRAGYSKNSAQEQGYQLVRKTSVKAAIDAAMAERSERTGITQDMVLQELGKLGFANMGDYMKVGGDGYPVINFADLDDAKKAALVEVTVDEYMDGKGEDARPVKRVKFKLADKRAALVDIGKHLGMFTDRVEHSGKNGAPIETVTQFVLAPFVAEGAT